MASYFNIYDFLKAYHHFSDPESRYNCPALRAACC